MMTTWAVQIERGVRVYAVDENGPVICEIVDNDQAEEYARLIAAAPELLDVLQLIQGQGWQLHDDEFGNEIKRRCLSIIAKATPAA